MIRECKECGQRNRVPSARLAETAKCGSCKRALAPLAKPLDVGPDEFRDVVRHAGVPVLVDFWATWCPPCRMAAPHVERVARELAGKAIVLKVDTEKHAELAAMFRVQGIPTFVVLRDGDVVRQQAGLVDHRVMKTWLEEAASARSQKRT